MVAFLLFFMVLLFLFFVGCVLQMLEVPYCCLGSCHILSAISMKILMICLIFFTMSTFVFSSNTNIFDSVLENLFLSLSILLVKIPISNLKTQMHHLLHQCCSFLQRKSLEVLCYFLKAMLLVPCGWRF